MEKIGFGIIGCGNIGPVHAAAINAAPHAKLIAVSDVVERNVLKLANQYNVEPYTDYRKMLERKDIQAVSICVPSGLRAEIAEDCAKAGKHILSEKPLEVTTKRIDRIINAADKAGV
ncbi:MAG TPA: Gfo/Idh/MocA family oxidoreductase, partial [Candidatus Hydrogenedens sp.]|nr:Gfo/Idh/MocA family oxidoreductase [Candidatus Hydrogenedens sp.]